MVADESSRGMQSLRVHDSWWEHRRSKLIVCSLYGASGASDL